MGSHRVPSATGYEQAEVRRDALKLVSAFSPIDPRRPRWGAQLRASGPALLTWAPVDRVFKLADAKRLAEAIPGARLELIADSKASTQEDRPERLAQLISAFIRETPNPPGP